QLNPLAMIISMILMLGIYLLLKRRELQLDPGDVWQSVWSSLMRSSLYRMDRKGLEERNWRPNIILFSGGTKNRPHLIEFGKSLVGKHGLLSNFHLVETKDPKGEILPKHKQAETSEDKSLETEGIFSRRHTCTNVYEGIEDIAQNYGFSGVEPNTVLMGWGRHTKEPPKFLEMLKTLHRLDMNILLIDYDKRKGFGNYKTIDIWWRGGANNSHLAIQLVKFLWLSEKWSDSKLRLMIINPINNQRDIIYKETKEILDSLRIRAEIRILNNEIENKPLYDIVRIESVNSDLIFLGLPFLKEGMEVKFIQNINSLCEDIGTVVLLRASTRIKPIELKANIQSLETSGTSTKVARIVKLSKSVPELDLPANRALADELKKTRDELVQSVNRIKTDALTDLFKENQQVLENLKKIIHETARKVTEVKSEDTYDRTKKLLKIKQNMLTSISNELIRIKDDQLENQRERIERAIAGLLEESGRIIKKQPHRIRINLSEDDLRVSPNDPFRVKMMKRQKLLLRKMFGIRPGCDIYYRTLLEEYFPLTIHKLLNVTFEKWGLITGQFVVELQKTIEKIESSFKGFINKEKEDNNSDEKLRTQILKSALETVNNLSEAQQESMESILPGAQTMIIKSLSEVSARLKPLQCRVKPEDELDDKHKILKKTTRWLSSIPEKWQRNQELFLNGALLETYLLTFSTRIQTIFNDIGHEIEIKLSKQTEHKQQKILDQVNDMMIHKPEKEHSLEENLDFEPDTNYYTFFSAVLDSASKRIRLGSRLFPASINLMSEDSFNEFHERQFSRIVSIKLSVNHFLDYLIQNELIAPLQNLTKRLPEDITRNNKSIREIVRVMDFTISEKKNDFTEDQLTDFIYKKSKDIRDILESTKILRNESMLQLKERISMFSDNLQYSVFRHKAFHSRQYIKTSEKEPVIKRLRRYFSSGWEIMLHQISKLYYRRSRGLILTQQLRQKLDEKQARVEDILDIVESVDGTPEVTNSLPFYYRQLFLRRQNYLIDFWVGREQEMKKAEIALKRHQSGHKGGILILGERYSGKTFLSQHIVNKLLYRSNLVIISPPHPGSVNRNDFKQAVISATDRSGDYDDIFSDMPSNSVILFEDLDLWWEKTADGMTIINMIMKIIRKYSGDYMFLVTVNKHAFTLINKIEKIERHFLSLIECGPMSAGELRKAVIQRHESGNLKLRLGKHTDKNIRPWRQARLFLRHFNYSRGNIGITLHSWINFINKFENGVITIAEPKTPDLDKLNYLETFWYITLLQILLHRRITAEKLARVLRVEKEEAVRQLETLYLSGLIIENGKNVYEINPVLYPHLMVKLNEMKII
ncbi:MAG: hypothetical protein ACOC4R_00840, partial [Bacteroidota bacterium]